MRAPAGCYSASAARPPLFCMLRPRVPEPLACWVGSGGRLDSPTLGNRRLG